MHFIRSDQKGRVGGVKGLVGFGQARDGGAELPLFEGVQTQARFVEQKNGGLVVVRALGKKDDEERNQPLKTFGALVQLNLDSDVVLDNDFEVLAVSHDAQTLRFIAFRIGHPGGAKFVGQANTGGVELVGTAIELIAIRLEGGGIAEDRFVGFPQIGKFSRAKPEQFQQTFVAVIVVIVVDQVSFGAGGE